MIKKSGILLFYLVLIFFNSCGSKFSSEKDLSQRILLSLRQEEGRGGLISYQKLPSDNSRVHYSFNFTGYSKNEIYYFYKKKLHCSPTLLGSYQMNLYGELASLENQEVLFEDEVWDLSDLREGEVVFFSILSESSDKNLKQDLGVSFIPKPIISLGKRSQQLEAEMVSLDGRTFIIKGSHFYPKELLLISSGSSQDFFYTGLQVDQEGSFSFYIKPKNEEKGEGVLCFTASGKDQEKVSLSIPWKDKTH